MKKMYLDQLEGILDRELWFYFKNEYEIKLNRLNADLQRHQNANIDYMVTGVKIPDVCHKANLSTSELPPEAAAQIVRETYASVTVQQKHVKMKFAEPFATIEKLIRLTKQGISEQGFDKFSETIAAHNVAQFKALKKSPKGSFDTTSSNSICMKWWGLRGKTRTF